MAVESNIRERKVEQISERLEKLKRRRIELKPETKSTKKPSTTQLKMPDFPNFPIIPLQQQNSINLTSFDNQTERLPKAEPLKMTDLKAR